MLQLVARMREGGIEVGAGVRFAGVCTEREGGALRKLLPKLLEIGRELGRFASRIICS